jgi:hypothetical protein
MVTRLAEIARGEACVTTHQACANALLVSMEQNASSKQCWVKFKEFFQKWDDDLVNKKHIFRTDGFLYIKKICKFV